MNTLRDHAGDLWEVLAESTYVPGQEENWIRYQDEEMRVLAAQRIALVTATGVDADEAADAVWAELYAQRGLGRLWVREVPHDQSTGDAFEQGPRGVYEVIAWFGSGITGQFEPGAMHRALVRPGPRWYAEQAANAAVNLTSMDPDDDSLADSRAEMERTVEYNRRAHRIASLATTELPIVDMQRRVQAEREAEQQEA